MRSARGDHARKVEYFVSLLSMPYVPVTSHVPLTLQSPVSPLKIYWKISAKFPQPAQTFHCLVKGKQPATGLSAVISNCYYTQPSLTRFFNDFSHTIFQMEAYCMKICRDTLLYLYTVQSRAGKVQLGYLIHPSSPLLQDRPLQYMYQICPYPYLTAQAISFHQFSSTKEVGAWLMFKHASSLSKWKERSPWN